MSKWEEYKKKLGDTRPWDVLDSNNYIDENEANKRFEICKSCPRLIQMTNQCRECGCFMKMKVKLEAATCPIGKW